MARERLVHQTVEQLLDRIVAGEFDPDQPLPSQPALAEEFDVSRLTVREAVETLRSRRIVQVVHGSGTFVNPPERWADADAISRLVAHQGTGETVSERVIEVRRMIEVGAAELCAVRRTEAEVVALESRLAGMRAAHASGDLDGFVAADMAFHEAILHGCHNPFLAVVYDPLMEVLRQSREQTSAVPQIREHAIAWHAAILEAVRAGDGPAARAAMADHMTQTSDDLASYVLSRDPSCVQGEALLSSATTRSSR